MVAAVPSTFERYALYLLASLVVALYAWGIVRTVGGGSGEVHARAEILFPPPLADVTSTTLPGLVLADYEISDPRSGNLVASKIHRTSQPHDLRRLTALSERKRFFIQLMMPLVSRANDRVLEQRNRLLDIEQKQTVGFELSAADMRWLERLAEEYGVEDIDVASLIKRVDVVPPSLALAQAAEESGWGTSRFAVEGNALFGQRVYRGKAGMVPQRRDPGKHHRVRAFDNIQESVSRYLHNLNTHWAYNKFRALRARMREEDAALDSNKLVGALDKYSERGEDYIKTIRSIISFNGLTALDRAEQTGRKGLINTPDA